VRKLELTLPAGWRRAQDISWRPTTWELRALALGGMRLEELSDQERKRLKLSDSALGLRVKHAGMYGKHAGAHQAGIRKDDIVISFDGIDARQSESQLIAHGAQQKKPGDKVQVAVLRGGKRMEFTVPMQ
jgi:predicted metalloprotease with PDZ domain